MIGWGKDGMGWEHTPVDWKPKAPEKYYYSTPESNSLIKMCFSIQNIEDGFVRKHSISLSCS